MAKKSQHKYDVADVYNVLNQNCISGGNPMTRWEIQGEIRREFNDAKWSSIMRAVREKVVKNGMIVPNACLENGYTYQITDDPNAVVPGMLMDLRKQSTIRRKTLRDREFIRKREGQLNSRLNSRVMELADIALGMEELLERNMKITNDSLRDAMDERRESMSDEAEA